MTEITIVEYGYNDSGLIQTMSKTDHSVIVIGSDLTVFEQLGKYFQGKIAEGIGFNKDILQKTQIERTDALAAFISSDGLNAVIAHIAKEIYHVPKVAARLYDREKAEIYKRLDVQTLSSTTWGIKHASGLLSYSMLNQVCSFDSGEAELVRVELPTLLVGRRVNELTVVGDTHVTAIERDNKILLPTTGAVFQESDVVYIVTTFVSGGQLRKPLGRTV